MIKYSIALFGYATMIALTIVGLFPSFSKSFFAGGSNESLMQMAFNKSIYTIGLLLICGYLGFRLLKKTSFTSAIWLVSFLLLWAMSGRTLAILPDGKIRSGWFFIPTEEINLCESERIDCQTVTDYQTEVITKYFWIVQINSNKINRNIFIGPFIWTRGVDLLNDNLGVGIINSSQ